ncbi:unnamed protein product [Arctogadus glacialis]
MKSVSQDQSFTDSELDRSYDPLTGHLPSRPNKKTLKQRFLRLLPCYPSASSSSTNQSNELGDGQLSTLYCRPEGLDALAQRTKFSRRELQILYREFKNECPGGTVDEEGFKAIYSRFFPQGDSSAYAHFLFRAFDAQRDGAVSFQDLVTGLSSILRGSVTERLSWAFCLYDLNHDGCISKEEMTDVMHSIYNLMGKNTSPGLKASAPDQHADLFSRKMDRDRDGVVTLEEFMETCRKDENIMQSMHTLDHVI